jgi:hypothetical protein
MHFLNSIPEIISQRHWSKNLHIHPGKCNDLFLICPLNPFNNGVSIKPGPAELMRIICAAYSGAAVCVSPITTCLAAAYPATPAKPTKPKMDETFTILPSSFFSMALYRYLLS